jgi:putative mRNA 3-end processing factor
MKVIEFTNKGLYCPIADVYIDPWKKVSYALITHGHADHARWGHKHYLCTNSSVPILKHRLGSEMNIEGVAYGEKRIIKGVTFSFHPAGHITGSAQIRVEYKGEIWVISGDYKLEDDGLSEAFEPVKCHHFITECTFGLPVYNWSPQIEIIEEINQWWSANALLGRPVIISAYSLGKAQRIISSVDATIGPILTHGAIEGMNEVYRNMNLPLPKTTALNAQVDKKLLKNALIIAPPSAISGSWGRKLKDYPVAAASGWMAIKNNRKRRKVDQGFVLSDHADWKGLLKAIKESGAENIYPTHGNTASFTQYLREQGYNANPVKTEFSNNDLDTKES